MRCRSIEINYDNLRRRVITPAVIDITTSHSTKPASGTSRWLSREGGSPAKEKFLASQDAKPNTHLITPLDSRLRGIDEF